MIAIMFKAHFILYVKLYVKDQAKSAAFYAHVLNQKPSLNIPGMTEFMLSDDRVLA